MKKRYFLPPLLYTLTMLLLIVGTIVVAYYVETFKSKVTIEPVAYIGDVHYYLNGTEITKSGPYYDANRKVYSLHGSDAAQVNFGGKLKISISMTTEAPARMRMRLNDEWTRKRLYSGRDDPHYQIHNIRPDENGVMIYPFTIKNNLFREKPYKTNYEHSNNWFYYPLLLDEGVKHVVEFMTTMPPLETTVSEMFFEELLFTISAEIQVVQANRFAQVWGVSDTLFG